MKKSWKKHNIGSATFYITLSVLILILIGTLFAPILAPYNPEELDVTQRLQGISWNHILGTDKVGRDIFSRILYGGRTTILSSFFVVFISAIVGIPLGLYCGYYGKKIDHVVMGAWNVILGFPTILLAFLLMQFVGRGIIAGVLAIGIVYIPMISRLTRSLAMEEKQKNYVAADITLGYSDNRIIYFHILPNCAPTIVAELTLDLAYAILELAGLSFLGLGVQAPQSDWGYMLSDAQQFLTTNPLQALAPGVMIIILVISLNLFSNEILRYLNPKERGAVA